ncbi:putative RTA1 domain protein [Annulohypoxylon maeteangense]|uniref:putative RTA1 domain protein n=1 Tax=Annulohypoxylon maeteangense TaxID=1927788 RepID=UPI002007D541|nr:putative RTA1 domain protein [Annulohypoxylon maeteangense]KAI0888535.1 putative RTA1 domain protein [Annulohypoxylon maeteangense]
MDLNSTGYNTGDGPYGPVVNGTQIVFYQYLPSKPAGFAFMALFSVATLGHLVYFFWLRAWFFIPFLLGGIAELFGYYSRAMAHDEPILAKWFILQNLLILAGAPFLAASVYMSLGRIAAVLDATHHSLLSLRWMTRLYVLIDFGCIFTQLIGSILPASGDPSAIRTSRIILLSGIITQFVALSFFVLQIVFLYNRIKRDLTTVLLHDPSIRWQFHFYSISLVALLLILRAVVRAVEYLQGEDGYVISHESFIYAFDGAPMFLVMLIFLILHPARLIKDVRRLKKINDVIRLGLVDEHRNDNTSR